jgi:hypothetical protein
MDVPVTVTVNTMVLPRVAVGELVVSTTVGVIFATVTVYDGF